MASLKHARSRPLANRGPIFLTIIVAGFMTFGGWPGWFNNDSRGMQLEAVQRSVSDWHSPVLTWFWIYLAPSNEELVIPYLIQIFAFWAGVILTVLFATRFLGWWAALIPLLTFGADHLWEINWLSKDATALSLVVLSLGFFASALLTTRVGLRLALFGAALFALGSISLARWYLVPASCVLMLTYLWGFGQARTRNPQAQFALLTVFAAGVFWPVLTEELVVRPSKSFHNASTQLLDLWRSSCLTMDSRISASKFPEELIVKGSEPICTYFSPFIWNEVNSDWQSAESTVTSVRLPGNETEATALRDAWLEAIRSDWPELLYIRLMTVTQLLRPAEYWTVAGSLKPSQTANARLSIARIPAEILASGGAVTNIMRNGALYVVILPMAIGIVVWRRVRLLRPWIFVGLAFPLAWVVNMALVAPAIDTRYVAPAIGASIYFSFVALGITSSKNQKIAQSRK